MFFDGSQFFIIRAGSRPMQSVQMHRSEKIADAYLGQIFITNDEEHHFLRTHNDLDAQSLTNLVFPRNECQTHLHLKCFFSQEHLAIIC